jgi:hypothetical protein
LKADLFTRAHVRVNVSRITFKEDDGPEKPEEPPRVQHWTVDEDGESFLMQLGGKPGPFQVLGRNPKYNFEIRNLTQTGGERKNGEWRLSQFHNSALAGGPADLARWLVLSYLQGPFLIWKFPVDVVFEPSALKNVSATTAGSGKSEVVTVSFEREGDPASEKNADYIAGGVVRFEPARRWAIRDYEIRARPPGPSSKRGLVTRVIQKCTYRSPGSIEPGEVQEDIERKVPNGLVVSRTTATILEAGPGTLATAAFTLPAFGVAEPPVPGSTSPFRSRWFWAIQAGIIALLLGLLIRRRAAKG